MPRNASEWPPPRATQLRRRPGARWPNGGQRTPSTTRINYRFRSRPVAERRIGDAALRLYRQWRSDVRPTPPQDDGASGVFARALTSRLPPTAMTRLGLGAPLDPRKGQQPPPTLRLRQLEPFWHSGAASSRSHEHRAVFSGSPWPNPMQHPNPPCAHFWWLIPLTQVGQHIALVYGARTLTEPIPERVSEGFGAGQAHGQRKVPRHGNRDARRDWFLA
jgi:hypothetical protein